MVYIDGEKYYKHQSSINNITHENFVYKILNFWFEKKLDYKKWFTDTDNYDEYIKNNFTSILKEAEKGILLDWLQNSLSYLAMIILLNVFSKKIYKNTKKEFINDKKALLFTEMGLDMHLDKLSAEEKIFVLKPYQDSENENDQILGIKILEKLIEKENILEQRNILKKSLFNARNLFKIIQKYHRFPIRNMILNRESTEEEIDYIDENY